MALILGGVLAATAAADPRKALLDEFRGAYPAHAPASSGVRSWSIVAAPAEVTLAGRKLAVWAYNGQVPGPTLRLRLGQTLRVELTNGLPQPTTIHWHGVRVPNAMDGVPQMTQPPVEPGHKFVYEYTPKDAGTFWFHPHIRGSEQVERGLYGVLVVEDRSPPPYTRDLVWVLDDLLLDPAGQIDPRFNTRHDLMHDGRWGNVITVNGKSPEELTVKAGERLRLRLLNSANGRIFVPDFFGLDAQVIAVDGMYAARPFKLEGFEMAPGNRLDLDLRIGQSLAGRSIRVIDRWNRAQPNTLAWIRVLDEVVQTPEFPSPAQARVPSWSGAEALAPDVRYDLNSRGGGKYGIEWTLNGEAFAGHEAVAHEHPLQTLKAGEWTKIRFTNLSYRLHPMHIHGQFYKLLARNGTRVDEPHWRDTVLVHPKETVDIGLVPLDRGKWMLHCHILEHAEAGMMTAIEVK
jgi:FtsP/CotA-like multicopper oxidase with cupredoxin domain